MPLRTKTFDLEVVAEDLQETKEEKAEEQLDYPEGSPAAQQAATEGQRADRFLSGIRWAMDEWDETSVTFGALTNGERHLVGMLVDADREAAEAMWQNAYIAVGTRAGPYLSHDPEKVTTPNERDSIRKTIGNLATVHPSFADWCEREITDLEQMDGDTGKSYSRLVAEKRRQRSQADGNG